MASRKERWDDVEVLRTGNGDQQWKIIEKWAPVLREYTPSLKITVFEDSDDEHHRSYIVQTWDPVAKSYGDPERT